MNKTAVKNYAVWARNELMKLVTQKAYEYEVTEENIPSYNADSVHGRLLESEEKRQLTELISEVKKNGFDHVVEETAYTWFNRFIALRYMEVNNYLPQRVRVFTDENNQFKPEILTEAIHLEVEGLDRQKVFDFIEKNSQDDLYKYLLLTICNDMKQYLPDMFTSISDYKSLLMPDNLLKEDGILGRMITDIDEDAWTDQVQIIGWLYQYYNSELKDAVMKKKSYEKDDIPPVTQLFTPDWIVRYMTENSLGRLWIDGHPDFDHDSWKYYLEEAEQKSEVTEQLNMIREEHSKLRPEDIKVIDPCMGSGHILVYAFDVLMDIYRDQGYSDRDAAKLILEKNLYGLEIDERAYHLAYFALMMKARSYNRRILSKDTKINVLEIRETSGALKPEYDRYLGEYKELAQYLIDEFKEAKELGSIVNLSCTVEKLNNLENHINNLENKFLNIDLMAYEVIEEINVLLMPLIRQAKQLTQKYDAVITNPPYMPPSPKQKPYIQKNYPDSKADLFAVFIEKCHNLTKKNAYQAMITRHTWMFLTSFEKLRNKILINNTIINMAHFGARAFEDISGEVVQTSAYIINNAVMKKYKSQYIKLTDYNSQDEKKKGFFDCNNSFFASSSDFELVPGKPIAYWVSKKIIASFRFGNLANYAECKSGIMTGKDTKFTRYWYEIDKNQLDFSCGNKTYSYSTKKWFPINTGGFRKWYGNLEQVVDIQNHGINIRSEKETNYRLRDEKYYFCEGIVWSEICTGTFSARYCRNNTLFFVTAPLIKPLNIDNLWFLLALVNSKYSNYIFDLINPTLHYNIGCVESLPVNYEGNYEGNIEIKNRAKGNVNLAKEDWDAFETSWDFKVHPLVKNNVDTINEAYNLWVKECEHRFNTLKLNEEELNRIFFDIYGLQDQLDPRVEDREVTVRKADLVRDIKSFISYAVGCMFGRYSLDKEGIVFAGGNFDEAYWKYRGEAPLNLDGSLPSRDAYAGVSLAKLHYAAIRDNDNFNKATKLQYEPDIDDIIPICDEEYFEDDIVTRFVTFVKSVYGEDTLEENLQFIASALGGKGTSREVLRNYFLNDFFNDHCKIYQKLPIYWQFDSGKKNGFKALVYIHRYTPDLIARMRTGYIHPLQSQYRTQIDMLNNQIEEAASTSEKVKLQKQLKKITEQSQELGKYEEKIHHWADKMETMDLDDGVKANYVKFQDLLTKIK